MAKLAQVRLKNVAITDNGYWEDRENVIAFTLLYPREGTPTVSTVRKAKLAAGQLLDFSAEMKKQGQPYNDLLFRETIRVESPLVVEISAVYSADWFGKVLTKALGAATGVAAGLLPVGKIGAAFLGSSVGSLFDQITPKGDDRVRVIAKGYRLLSPGMDPGEVKVDLTVPDDVTLWKAPPPPTSMGTAPPQGQERTLKKNDPNGAVTLSVELFDV